jgi:hypothetical protein
MTLVSAPIPIEPPVGTELIPPPDIVTLFFAALLITLYEVYTWVRFEKL